MNGKLLRSAILLSLPTVAVNVLGIHFLVDRVPEIEKGERDRVKAVYRETALAIKQDHSGLLPENRGEWKPAGKMAPGRWGYQPIPVKRVTHVWYEDADGTCYASTVAYEPERDYRTMFYIFGTFFLFVLAGITVLGIRYFVSYVKTRDDFLAAAAHDLTTPLVCLRNAIGRDAADAQVLNERMIRIVSNIKDFLRLGGRRPKAKADSFDLLEAYREAYLLFRDDYRDLFDGKDVPVHLGTVSPDTKEIRVLADETLTVQILWNLLGNDLKYAAPHGPVRVEFSQKDSFAVVEFIDGGPGMTPRQMRRAFDRYYRAKTVLETGKGGFGIGLCTAREFAEEMGGRLTVRANSPQGCIFRLQLPGHPPFFPRPK